MQLKLQKQSETTNKTSKIYPTPLKKPKKLKKKQKKQLNKQKNKNNDELKNKQTYLYWPLSVYMLCSNLHYSFLLHHIQ